MQFSVNCGNPDPKNNGKITTSGLAYGAILTLTCDDGFEITTNVSVVNVSCTTHGSWGQVPNCVPKMCHPLALNSKVVARNYSANERYPFKTVVTFDCDTGYVMKDNKSSQCQANRQWSHNPSCIPINCTEYVPPPNAAISSTTGVGYAFMNRITVACKPGHEIRGSSNVTCKADKSWTESPDCLPINCTMFDIPLHSQLKTQQNGPQYIFNTTLTIVCFDGYLLRGTPDVTCRANKTWTALPICEPVQCVEFKPPANSMVNASADVGTHFNETVNIVCDLGYRLNQSDVFTEACQADGNWTSQVACTIVSCDDIPDQSNGIINGSLNTYQSNKTLTCVRGFELKGASTSTCFANGTWSSFGVCNPVPCPGLPAIPNSNMTLSVTGKVFNDSVVMKCLTGHILNGSNRLECTENGQWSSIPTCDPVDCGEFTPSEFGIVNATVTVGRVFNESVTIYCQEGYEFNDSSKYAEKCLADGTWTSQVVCKIVRCNDTENPANSEVTSGGTTFQSNKTMTCDTGYFLTGPNVSTCQANKTWTYFGVCDPVPCSVVQPISNSNVTNLLNGSVFGDIFVVGCLSGYVINGSSVVRCLATGLWSSITTCDPVDCGAYSPPEFGLIDRTVTVGRVFNETVTLYCQEGYELNDTSKYTDICLANGRWTSQVRCKIVHCNDTDIPVNSEVTGEGTTFQSNKTMTCITGYYLTGPKVSTCQANKTWTEFGVCNPVPCPEVEPIPNSNVSSSLNESVFEDNFVVMCMSGYVINGTTVVSCLATGLWSANPTCDPVNCGEIIPPENGALDSQFPVGRVFNDTVNIVCDEGYELENPSQYVETCLADGNWTSHVRCNIISCNATADPENSVVSVNTSTYLSRKSMTCNSGFYISGPNISICQSNKTWTDLGVCLRVHCPTLDPIPNSNLSTSLPDLRFEAVIYVTCELGYVINGSNNISCLAHENWSHFPSCDPVECVEFSPPRFGIVDNTTKVGRVFNETVRIICNTGYNLNDSSKNTETCQADRNWTANAACTIVTCNDTMDPENSNVTSNGNTYRSVKNITCTVGYDLSGSNHSTCQANGTWSALGTCFPVPCHPVGPIVHSNVTTSLPGRVYGDRIFIECSPGYILNGTDDINCTASGQWTPIPRCNPVECHEFVPPENGNVNTSFVGKVFNETINIYCDVGYNLRNISENFETCQADGNWSSDVECTIVTCPIFVFPNNSINTSIDNIDESQVNLTCIDGYTVAGQDYAVCQSNGSWREIGRCDPNPCPELSIILDSNITQTIPNRVFGDNVTVSCHQGFESNGREIDFTFCNSSGLWSKAITCSRTECVPIVLPNNTVVGNLTMHYLFEESVNVSCSTGYKLFGNNTITCLHDKTWSQMPHCVECSQLEVANGTVNQSGFEILEVQCDPGFVLVENTNVACIENGSWSDVPFCQFVDCGPFDPVNGSFHSETTYYQSIGNVTCDIGFEHNGRLNIECNRHGQWVWNGTCARVTCGLYDNPPFSILNGSVSNISDFNTTLQLNCDVGYSFVNETSTSVRCGQTGAWEGHPECTIDQCFKFNVSNGLISPVTEIYDYNSSVTVTCNTGFSIKDQHASTVEINVTCGPKSVWSSIPECIPNNCTVPVAPANSTLNFTQELYVYGDEVQVTCDSGFDMIGNAVLVCAENGTWNNTSICAPVNCSDNIIPANGSVSSEKDIFSFPDIISVQCNEGFRLNGSGSVECQANGKWSDYPTCHEIRCGSFEIPNGLTNGSDDTYGTVLNVTCNTGYVQDGGNIVECNVNGTWTQNITCTLFDCGDFNVPENATYTVAQSNTSFNSSLEVSCVPGTRLENESFGSITCTMDGWSSQPKCVIPGKGSVIHK